ncbi:MAG: hypothetical protein PVH18_03730 [Chloroflexota bacterium]|jgi:hypothetical protein
MLAETVESADIYLEIGQKKVCAVALEWPGWCRFGKDERLAIQALLEYGPRYAKIAQAAGLTFQVPESIASFNITDRLDGNATTDFGAPDSQLANDWRPIENQELQRIQKILSACWLVFDESVAMGEGKELQKGPRGGGRELTQIVKHVIGAEESYLRVLGWKAEAVKGETIDQRKLRVRNEVLRGLKVAADGQLPREGPRGGKRWPPRFFVRRLAWHVVDHAWEIEDRIIR